MLRTKVVKNKFDGKLSATAPSNVSLSLGKVGLGTEERPSSTIKPKTILRSKKILRVYIDSENKTKFIDREAAEELFLAKKVRRILINREIKYQITDAMINKICSNKGPIQIEIEYVELPPKEKQTCRVYYYDRYKYIDRSSAFAMGFVDVKGFNNSDERYEISEKEYDIIKTKYKIELFNIRLVEEEKSKEDIITL